MRPHGGSQPLQMAGFGVTEALRMFAEDIWIAPDTMRNWRWVASGWPAKQRRDDVPFRIHRVLAAIADADQRFAVIGEPPVLARTGERPWTEDEAKRRVGWQVSRPETVQEKASAVRALVRANGRSGPVRTPVEPRGSAALTPTAVLAGQVPGS